MKTQTKINNLSSEHNVSKRDSSDSELADATADQAVQQQQQQQLNEASTVTAATACS